MDSGMKVWKYQLPLGDGEHQKLAIPAQFARILTVQMQRDVPCLWVLVDPSSEVRVWHFHWVGTGCGVFQEVIDGGTYVGTVQTLGFVFHLFESGYESEVS